MLQIAAKRGAKTPGTAGEPTLDPDLLVYYNAFLDLSATRQAGFAGPQAITYTEIAAYVSLRGYTESEFVEQLIELIRAMDHTYLNWSREMSEISDRERQEEERKRELERKAAGPQRKAP